VIAAALTTPFVYYLVFEPSYSHTFSAFAVAAFLFVWWRTREQRTAMGWLVLGVLGGVMGLVRWQDGPLMAMALLDWRRAGWRPLLLLPGALLAFSPQLWVDQVVFGTWFPMRPSGQTLQWWPGHYLEVLFSTNHGLFVWSPVMLAAVAGMLLVKDWRLRAASLYALVVETAINGAAPDWWAGYSFGMRRFLDLTPFVAVGLAALALWSRPAMVRVALGLAAVWNFILIANLAYVLRDQPTMAELIGGQLHAVRFLPRLFVQGYVVRALAVWPVLHQAPDVLGGIALLGAELLALAAALALVKIDKGEHDFPILAHGEGEAGPLLVAVTGHRKDGWGGT
jgi:hypothetical protein